MSAQMPCRFRGLLALLSLVALIESSHAAPTNAPPAPEVPNTDGVARRLADDPDTYPWPTADRRVFADLLRGRHYAWLVAPTQVQKEGFDRVQRSMISAMLGRALARADTPVPDTY